MAKYLTGAGLHYCNPHKIAKQRFSSNFFNKQKHINRYKDGYYSDGAFIIKISEKEKATNKYGFAEDPPDMKKFLDDNNKNDMPLAHIIATVYENESNDDNIFPSVYITTEDKKIKNFFNVKFIDLILTRLPNSKAYYSTDQLLIFKEDKEPVAAVMPLRLEMEYSKYINNRIKKLEKEYFEK